MTDEELIARLLDWQEYDEGKINDAREEAADRIEQLVATNEALTKERDDYAHKLMQANNTYTEMHLEIERLSDKLAENEVRLRKAVEALGLIVVDNTWGLEHETYMKCRKALAEIKGDTP